MDIKEIFHNKTALIVVGVGVGGMLIYSFLHRGSSSASSTSTFNPSSGSSASPTQYLVPYNAYFTGSMPDGGSTSTAQSPTTGPPSSSTLPTSTPVSSPAPSTPVSSPVASTPAPAAPVQTAPDYQKVWTPTQSKQIANSGAIQYGLENGSYVPVMVGNTPTAAYASYEAANNNRGALYTLAGG